MIVVLLETKNGQIKKSSLEAASFAGNLGDAIGSSVTGIIPKGSIDIDGLGKFGLNEIYEIDVPDFLDTQQWTQLLSGIDASLKPEYFILSNDSLGRSVAGRLSVKLNKALISNVIQFNSESGKPIFKKSVFSGKAFGWFNPIGDSAIIALMPHAYGIFQNKTKELKISTLNVEIPVAKVMLKERNLIKGKTPLTEADIVVSAGRGLKDPTNWKMIEELATNLNATLACSRPVADAGWRPHHEHVGQTGIAIRPNVYIAIGISGAIQHLAGVNNSKNIIVINKDPEAPFFKAADYGICGDLFEIIPKLNEALSKVK
jgi:electron transfer flavoprotein alpha subunit